MGTRNYGQVCYGVQMNEHHVPPWDEGYYAGDFEGWWVFDVNGYPRLGEGGKSDNYYEGMREIVDQCPVEIVDINNIDWPIWVVALKRTVQRVGSGRTETLNRLDVTDREKAQLEEFISKHGIDIEGREPAWLLSSYIDW